MRIFISHILPKEHLLKYKISIAAHNFSYALIEGLVFDKTYSILPSIKIAQEDLNYQQNITPVYFSFFHNIFFIRKLSFLFECLFLFFKIPKKADVWFYNLPILTAPLFILLKVFRRSISVNVIILDYTPVKSGKRYIIAKVLLYLMNHANGTIRLADSPLFVCKKSLCLAGVIPLDFTKYQLIDEINDEFLISGALGENISMLSMLLSAFSKMPDLKLHVTGEIPDESILNEYLRKCDNIIYHGKLSVREYLDLLDQIPFILSTRNPECLENQCNFPSKIIEALFHNRIVISTLYYKQLEGIKYFKVSSKEDLFVSEIIQITKNPRKELLKYANQSDKVKERFNPYVWDKYMSKIENL